MAALPITKSRTVEAIEAARVAANEERESRRLGASILGEECDRKLWYAFRWASAPEKFEGRMLRLFETGHEQEARMIADLRRAGITLLDREPDNPDEQITFTFVAGHVVCKVDGMAHNIPEAPSKWHVFEAKSHNEKSFKSLAKGVQASKPLHFAQVQIGMHGAGVDRALYLAVNKNDDDLYAERIEYNATFALDLLARAERIIRSEGAPMKLHEDRASKAAFACNWCQHVGICHEQQWARRNCRTCLHSTPSLDGDGLWTCARFEIELTPEGQAAGCPHHIYIPDLVPGEQTDADIENETVTYRLFSGVEFVDGLNPEMKRRGK